MAFFTEDVLTSAKLRSFMPISQTTFQDSDLILVANEELLLKMVSDIISVREDFFLSVKTTAITGGIDHYTIPKGAVGNTIKVLLVRDSNGNERVLDRIDASSRGDFAGQTGAPVKFFFEGDEVVLCPKPDTSTDTLVFVFFKKPNKLIETTSCAKITNISSAGGTTTFTVDTDLTADLSVGATVDFLSAKSPYLLWNDEIAITAITSTTIAVATSDVSNAVGTVEPVVNDYICPSGYANIPQVPDEAYPVLCQMVAVRALASLGDLNKWNAAKAELKEMRSEMMKLMKNRAEATPITVTGSGLASIFNF